MNRRARKILSNLLALILIFAPMETMRASQGHPCDEAKAAIAHTIVQSGGHAHMSVKAGHDEQPSAQPGNNNSSKCPSCMDKQCCCDIGSCTCVMLHSMFVPPDTAFDFSSNRMPSSIPFVNKHHGSPLPVFFLRPPISLT